MMPSTINVELCCALDQRAFYQQIDVAVGTSAQALFDALRAQLLAEMPELEHVAVKLGIHSRLLEAPESYILQEGDRVEVYRPLIVDPKAARRQRADKARLDQRRAEQERRSAKD